jgi:hypothetical protein
MSKKTLGQRIKKLFNPGPKLPTHAQKQAVVREFARRYGLRSLVETGTCHGDMVAAMQGHFDRVYSIELCEPFYREVCERFKGVRNVELIQGDSARVLPGIIARLDAPALFWLDGHYSGGDTALGDSITPVNEELRAIFKPDLPAHVVLIDDARCFGVYPEYPTIEKVREIVHASRPGWHVDVENDCIRIHPGS